MCSEPFIYENYRFIFFLTSYCLHVWTDCHENRNSHLEMDNGQMFSLFPHLNRQLCQTDHFEWITLKDWKEFMDFLKLLWFINHSKEYLDRADYNCLLFRTSTCLFIWTMQIIQISCGANNVESMTERINHYSVLTDAHS